MELFRDLPEDLRLQCLVRVPFAYHNTLRIVCKEWKAVVESPQFYQDRKRLGTFDELIATLSKAFGKNEVGVQIYDPLHNSWQRLPPLPNELQVKIVYACCKCVAVNHKVVLMGLFGCQTHEFTGIVIYDLWGRTWKRGKDMPVCHKFFSCCVSPRRKKKQYIYIAGSGYASHDRWDASSQAAVYSVEEDEWEQLPRMNIQFDASCRSSFIDGKFFVASRVEPNAQIYDPQTRAWTTINNFWGNTLDTASGLHVAAFGRLFSIRHRIIKAYNFMEKEWSRVGYLPHGVELLAQFATPWRDCILFSGRRAPNTNTVFYLFRPYAGEGKGMDSEKWTVIMQRAISVFSVASIQI